MHHPQVELASGFPADYVRVGEGARELMSGRETLEIGFRSTRKKRKQAPAPKAGKKKGKGGTKAAAAAAQGGPLAPLNHLEPIEVSSDDDEEEDEEEEEDSAEELTFSGSKNRKRRKLSGSQSQPAAAPASGGKARRRRKKDITTLYRVSKRQAAELEAELDAWRRAYSEQKGSHYWRVLDSSEAKAVAALAPRTMDELACVPGFGGAWRTQRLVHHNMCIDA
jgi:hypothetical protein